MNTNYHIQNRFSKAVIGAVLLLPLLLSCAKKELEVSESVGDVLYSFKAEIDMGFIPEDLKSTVTLATGASSFVSGDEVAVTLGSTIGIYRYDGSTFNFVSGTAQSGTLTYATAFYPASMVTGKGDGRSFNLSLEDLASQSYQTTTLSNLPMGGRFIGTGTSTFKFYNLCTILKISASDGKATSGKTLSSVTFTSHEASISGAAGYANGKMQMDPASDDDDRTITVTGSPSSLGSPTPWYLILPSQTYPGGFEMNLVFSDGKTFTYSTSNTVALQPGYISAMDAFTCEYFSGGSGSKANPYRIANEADLTSMRTKVQSEDTDDFRNKHYILLADIDCGGTVLNTIGTENNQFFTGSFDGQGHTIRNFVLYRSQKWIRSGFIGTLDGSQGGGVLKNLNLINASTGGDVISGTTRYPRWNDYTAIFAARAINGALIENCHVDGCTIDSEASYVGAIAGELNASTIRNCSATSVNIRGCGGSGNEGVGGLVGSVTGTSASLISNCTCSGSVTAIIRTEEMAAKGGPAARDAHHGGGIAGTVRSSPGSTIEHCSFTGTLVSEGGALAGVVGDMKGSTVIRNCTVGTGTTITGGSSQNNIGGIAGYVYSRDSGVSAGEISGCTFRGSVTGSGDRTAGIVAVDGEVAVNNCTVENASITGVLEVGGIVGSLGGQTVRSSFVKSSSITGSNIRVGGIVGRINGANAVITDCGVETTTVQGTGNFDEAYVGGIIGVTDNTGDSTPARIVRCYSSGGSVSAIGRKVGGIAGALTSRSLVDGCWSTTDVLSDVSTGGYSGHVGGIVGSLVPNAQNTMVINCTYYGGSVKDLGPNHGAAAGIVGSVAYTYAVGDIMPNYVVNCFANPKEVSTGQYAVGGVGGYLTRDIMDNCYSPTPSSALKRPSGVTNNTGSLVGTMRRGGRIVNCYSLFQGSGSHDTGTDAASIVEDTWQVTILSDADMKATSKTITVASSGASAASLTDALNKGAVLYNNGGDGIAHHGTLPFGARAQSWVKSTDEGAGKGYPVLSCSPLCDADPDTYAHTVTVDNPNLTIYMPPRDNNFKGKLIILVPGGGYHYLASVTGNEGEGWVSYYNDLGYACAVLRYTLPGGNPALPIADLENAIKYVRDHSSSLHINSVGVHGFSAGGHLASTIATHYTAATRPDFQILFYPVITMGTGTHANSKNNFLGTSPSAAMVTLYSNQLQVTADTPKAFLMYYDNDGTVTPSYNGAAYYTALNTAGVSVTRKIFTGTTHGWNNTDKVDSKTVRQHLTTWLGTL